jgi:hypothetical protein
MWQHGGGLMLLGLVISLFLIVFACWNVSRKDGSTLNWLTPTVVVTVPSIFILPYIYTLYFSTAISPYAQIYISACYVIGILLPALIYRWISFPALGWSGPRTPARWAHWIVLALAELTYMPILVEFRSQLLDPRAIYLQTRRGYGLTFYSSALLLNIAAILFFFRKSKSIAGDLLFWVIISLSSLEHGSKDQLIAFFWIWILYRVYVEKRPFRFMEATRIVVLFVAVIISIFVVFGNAQLSEFFKGLSVYDDYTRNAAIVIDDPDPPVYYGLLKAEDAIYSRVPRTIFANKPTLFGQYKLIHRYFPNAASEDYSPSLGVGSDYADFGPLAFFFIAGYAAVNGIGCCVVIRKLRTDPNPGNLLLLVFFSGVQLIPIGVGYLLPETVLLSWIVLKLSTFPAIRIIGRRRSVILEGR